MPTTTREGAPTEPPPSAEGAELESASFDDPRRLSNETESTLLGMMADQDNNPGEARDAWDELYRRHVRYVYFLTNRCCRNQLAEDEISDVVIDTFKAAFQWAGRQQSPAEVEGKFDDPDADRVRRRVLGWLGVIARRKAIHCVEGQRQRHDQLREDEAAESENAEPPSRLAAALSVSLEALGQDEAEALQASLPWYNAESQQFLVPRGEASRIAASLGTTVEALRQRRHRSLRRLKAMIEKAAE